MCGFLVQFSSESEDFKNFEKANNLLENRGPDNTGYYNFSDNCKFGFKRLSILDLDTSAKSTNVRSR